MSYSLLSFMNYCLSS